MLYNVFSPQKELKKVFYRTLDLGVGWGWGLHLHTLTGIVYISDQMNFWVDRNQVPSCLLNPNVPMGVTAFSVG